MALVLKDRVKETTTTTGTGTYTLAGAVAGFEAFSEIGNSNTTYYCCTDGTDFEVGIGTYTLSGTTLARTTILQSSNSDNAVNWSSGSRTIFCTQPAEKAVFLDGSGNISIPGTIDGRDLATDGTKLDGIEANATADQTASEIRTLVESASDSNVFTDADHTKLNGIEASADVTDTANVTAAGALMDSEVTNLAQVKAFDSSDYATAAQGTTADAAMPKAGGTFTGDVTFTGDSYNVVWDKSDNALEFADNAKVTFGADGDLEIFHSGTASVIRDGGTGPLRVRANATHIQNPAATETMASFTQNGAVELYYDNAKKLETTADGVTITSTDAGASNAPILTLYRDSASPADFDNLGNILFVGKNDADQDVTFAEFESINSDVSDGTEDGLVRVKIMISGTLTNQFDFANYANVSYKNLLLTAGRSLLFEGGTDDANETTLTATDPTADRTITLPDANGTVLLTDGDGSSLTALNATQLTSGTVPNARLDAQLQDVAGLAVTDGNFIVGDGSNFVAESGATARTSLGLGSIATQASNNVSITGGSVSGITDLAIADGGTGASSASAARTNLGLGTIATQAADSVNIDGGAVDGITLGTNSAVTEAQIDNININGNSITSTDTNGNIGIAPNGTGDIQLNTDTVRVGDSNANATITTNGTGDLTLNTNSGTNSGSIVIADGANGNISITPDGSGVLDVISTDDGNTIGPKLHLYRNSASPADFDDLGGLVFTGNNSAGDRHEYALIRSEVADVTDGSEDAYIQFFTNVGGSSVEHMVLSFGSTTVTGQLKINANAIHSNPHIKFEGSTANAHETTFNVTDPTADRTITLPDATGTVLTTGNSDTPTTTTSSSDADFVLVDDGGTMKKITPANLGITAGAASTDDATALAIALG
jgi:hypothetical protein